MQKVEAMHVCLQSTVTCIPHNRLSPSFINKAQVPKFTTSSTQIPHSWGHSTRRPNNKNSITQTKIQPRWGHDSARRSGLKKTSRHQKPPKRPVQSRPVPVSTQRVPLLHEGQKFKHRVRSTAKEDTLDNHLISNSPKRPGYRGKHKPEEAPPLTGTVCLHLQELSKVSGLPLRSKRLGDEAPQEASSGTGE